MRICTPLLLLALLHAAPARADDTITYLVVRNAPLAGFRHYEGRLVWGQLREGDTLALVREPDNPYDADAVRLEWNGRTIGYVPRLENSDLAQRLDAGMLLEARVTGLEKRRNGRCVISYDILVPLAAGSAAQAQGK